MREKETTLYIGPQHPGITGNMMVKVKIKGDTIVSSSTHVGYLHRGFEKLMERRNWIQNIALILRVCVVEPDINEAAYSMAVEAIESMDVPERALWIRTMILEMARVATHMMSLGGIGGPTGLYTGPNWALT